MKTFTRKHAAALGLASLALGLGALRLLHTSSAPTGADAAATMAADVASSDVPKANGPALPSRRWKEGDSFVYDVDTTRSMAISTKTQADQIMSFKVAGKLRLSIIGTEANDLRLRADMRAANVEISPKIEENGASWVSRTFYLRALPKGEIEGFFFPKEVPAQARLLLKGVVNSLQMVAPPAHEATWQAVEQDVSGQYDATYRALDGFTVEKSKTQYLRTRGPAGFLPMPKDTQYVVKSSATFEIDPSGWPKTLTEDESLEISVQNIQALGKIKTKAALVALESHPEWIGAFPADLEPDTVSEAAAMAIAMKQADLNMVGGKSFTTIIAELNSGDPKARNQAQARMAALFRVDPNEAKKASEEILHGKGDLNSKKRLIGALGNAGTKEAQHELSMLLDTQEAGDRRVNAAIALSLTKHPTEETAATLKKAAASPDNDVANTATLAAGNVVRTMNAEQSGDTTDAVQMLMSGLANASSDAQRKLYLDALGNTGDARALVAIAPYLTHTTVVLRAAATGALKFMLGNTADTALVAAMSDSESAVRKAAVHTIAFRPIVGVIDALDTLLKTEPEVAIRLEILKGMNVKLLEDTSVLDSVEWAMDNDASATVRAFAKQIVEHNLLEEP